MPDTNTRWTMAEWARRALAYPQTHPQTGSEITEYANMFGANADSPDTTPWSYQDAGDPDTPENFTQRVVASVGRYYNPIAGQVYAYRSQSGDPFDPAQMTPPVPIYGLQPSK